MHRKMQKFGVCYLLLNFVDLLISNACGEISLLSREIAADIRAKWISSHFTVRWLELSAIRNF